MKLKVHDRVKVIDAPNSVPPDVIGAEGKICEVHSQIGLYTVDCGAYVGTWYLAENEVELIEP
jgi:hypothetical protein